MEALATGDSEAQAVDSARRLVKGFQSQSQQVNANGSVTFQGLASGSHTVAISRNASNCSVQGSNPRAVNLTGSQLTETFNVDCQSAGITVTVQTTGDPSPATGYDVQVDTVTQSVGVNGSVTFASVAVGPHIVRLDNVPGHCLVQGQNPRSVDAPASVTFDVVCQQPAACVNPPAKACSR